MKQTKDSSLFNKQFMVQPINITVPFKFLLNNSAGWITENINNPGSYFIQNGNDLGNIDLYDMEDDLITLIGKVEIAKGLFIYITKPTVLNPDICEFMSLNSAINELVECWN